MLARSECKNHTHEYGRTAEHLLRRQASAKPKPFDEGRQGSSQARAEHHGETRTQPWQSLKERQVSEPKTDAPADEKDLEGRVFRCLTPKMGDETEQERGET